MMNAATTAEYKSNIGHDFALVDAHDAECWDAPEETEEDEAAARQALNAKMAEWFGI